MAGKVLSSSFSRQPSCAGTGKDSVATGDANLFVGKDSPRPRPVQLPKDGEIVELPEVGGLHHRYERRAA